MTTFGVTKCPPTFFRQNFTQDSGSQGSLQQKVHCIITYVVDCNFAIRNRSGEMIMVERDHDDFWIMDEQTCLHSHC
jgi:hypothetical protein